MQVVRQHAVRLSSRNLKTLSRSLRPPLSTHDSPVHQRRESGRAASFSGRSSEKEQLILGIESSCDDTGIAVLRASDGKVLGHSIASQADIHAPWGGVVPTLAMEAHRQAMDGTLAEVLRQAQLSPDQLDAVAVTIGPGLSLCLKIGVVKAIRLAHQYNLKYVPVHHMEAHALLARQFSGVQFPFLCLLVSGGHNMLLVAHGIGNYTLLGTTLDDAVGEAFDKIARLLGLELQPNGGAALERFAEGGDPLRFPFSIPLRKYQDCNFSYAGLKSAVRLVIEEHAPNGPTESNKKVRADIAASFQHVAIRHLANRVARGVEWGCNDFPELRHFVAAGGVAANRRLRNELQEIAESAGLEFVCPPPSLCTDNGVMIAWAGVERLAMSASRIGDSSLNTVSVSPYQWLRQGFEESLPPLPLPGDEFRVDVRPRWPLTDRLHRNTTLQKRSQRKSRIFPSLTELTAGSQELAASA